MAKSVARLVEGAVLQVGDCVVTMSAPGRFRVVAVDGDVVTIENDDGVRKPVLEGNLRTVPAPASK